MNLKFVIQRLLYSRWKKALPTSDGFTIMMPIPEDMPFLFRLAMEGITYVDTSNCNQVLVIGDGRGNDHGAELVRLAQECNDERIEVVLFSRLDRAITRRMPSPYWLTVVYGINHARHPYIFLHDSDAFFLEKDAIERTYAYCSNKEMYSAGVTARWDPFFTEIGYEIPGTWQCMVSVSWIRKYRPYYVRGRLTRTPHGTNIFDSLLYPQYLDYDSGRIGVMENPHGYVHVSGTVVTYRAWQRAKGGQVVDELFRLLFLSILERLFPANVSKFLLPSPDELARGLRDDTEAIRYDTLDCARNYAEFRDQIRALCSSPIFEGDRASLIEKFLQAFDEHYSEVIKRMGDSLGGPTKKFRRTGLAGGEVD